MEWQSEAIITRLRPHGESSLIVYLLAAGQGLHAGLLRRTKRNRHLQVGDRVDTRWRGRMSENLGVYQLELLQSHAGNFFHDPKKLLALNYFTALLSDLLLEKKAFDPLYSGSCGLLELLSVSGAEDWPFALIKWEIGLLAALGYGLQLEECAATGSCETLYYVSPRTGRAVSQAAGQPYRNKLLKLPEFLRPNLLEPEVYPHDSLQKQLSDGFELSGYFLQRQLLWPLGKELPETRQSLIAALIRPIERGQPSELV